MVVGGRLTLPTSPNTAATLPSCPAPPRANEVSCSAFPGHPPPAAEGRIRETSPHPRGLAEPHSLLTTQQKWGQSEAWFGTRSSSAHGGHNSVG